MGKHLLLLALMVVYATYLVHSQGKLYPDWRCHPGYVSSSPGGNKRGDSWIKFIMDKCQQEMKQFETYIPEKICYKSCILQWHYITVWGGGGKYESRVQSEDKIAKRLNYTFPDNLESRNKIAKRIYSECAELGSKLPHTTTCGDRTEFFSCVEKAWSCEGETPTTRRNSRKKKKWRSKTIKERLMAASKLPETTTKLPETTTEHVDEYDILSEILG